ncbi:MAG: polysaccharide biosynthesis/export family protein [Prevotellaceae bacterium]|jgi:polysaccharide export outer membrane protein|nr:polysaccharide biosynthesis/export family protein [Prevotellaceae bacterium]
MKKPHFLYTVVLLVVIGLLSSCYSRRSTGYLQERSSLPQYKAAEYEEYRLRENDEIVIRIITIDKDIAAIYESSSNITNTMAYRIYPDGTVDIPFLSGVSVLNMTLNEVQQAFEKRLSDFAPDIRVKVALNTGTFCVIGDASRGYFPIYKERLTIFQALAIFGDIHETAQFSAVKIIREKAEGTVIKSFDIRSKSIIDSEFYYIYPNDIIYLDLSKKKFWGVNSYSSFLSIVTTPITLALSVWNMIEINR